MVSQKEFQVLFKIMFIIRVCNLVEGGLGAFEPTVSPLKHVCGSSFWPIDQIQHVSLDYHLQVLIGGAITKYPTELPHIYETPVMWNSFWSVATCNPSNTMKSADICKTCLDFLHSRVRMYCSYSRTASINSPDCELRYSFDGPPDYCVIPP